MNGTYTNTIKNFLKIIKKGVVNKNVTEFNLKTKQCTYSFSVFASSICLKDTHCANLNN